jgi:hypothetical protein
MNNTRHDTLHYRHAIDVSVRQWYTTALPHSCDILFVCNVMHKCPCTFIMIHNYMTSVDFITVYSIIQHYHAEKKGGVTHEDLSS